MRKERHIAQVCNFRKIRQYWRRIWIHCGRRMQFHRFRQLIWIFGSEAIYIGKISSNQLNSESQPKSPVKRVTSLSLGHWSICVRCHPLRYRTKRISENYMWDFVLYLKITSFYAILIHFDFFRAHVRNKLVVELIENYWMSLVTSRISNWICISIEKLWLK